MPNFPILRSSFEVTAVKKATLRVVGLGYFHAYINGKKVTEDLFLPLNTDYEPRKDYPVDEVLTGHRLYVPEFDVTELIASGRNTLAVHFGGGWYTYKYGPFGDPKVIYRLILETEAGIREIVSSENDRIGDSVVRISFAFKDEHQDYLNHNDDVLLPIFDDSDWPLAQLAKAVDTDYKTTDCPADRVMEILHPKEIGVELKKTWYDIGKNGTSLPVLRLRAPKGHMVRVLFSEGWMEAGGLDMRYVHEQAFTVISDGKERIVEPMFTWFGYRYLMVEGDADLECVKVIHANVPVSSRFSCDNETLNWLYSATVNGLLTNMHGGIVSDCPQVERRGYTGDGQNTCHTALTLLDAQKYYNKWIQDVSDCQDTLSGHVQYTAPYYESGGGSGGWGCAIVEMPYQYYKHFGDLGFLRDMYDQILQYFEYMESHSVNHLLVRDKEGAWCLGDWCPPTNMTIILPPPMVNNYFYIRSLKEMIEVAPLLGKEADIPLFEKRIREREEAIMAAYFNPADGDFAGGQQGANAFAVDLGLGDERTYQRLVKRYEKLGGYDTGIFGTPILTRVLFEHGNPELAVKLLLSENPCSYEVMRRMGATTLWENWPNAEWDRSRNHPMFGAVTAYLFDYLLGIRQKADSAGYRELVIAPAVVPQINHASGARQIPAGQVSVAWEKCDAQVRFSVEIPAGVTATFCYGETVQELQTGMNEFLI